MATNEILGFADDPGANVLSQAAFAGHAHRPIGNQPGVASAQLNNKVLRQASIISRGIAQWLADKQAANVVDTLSAAALSTMVQDAIKACLTGFSSYNSIAGAATLTVTDIGKSHRLSGSSYTVNIPVAGTCPAGSALHFTASLTGVVTLARQGADTIAAGNGADSLTGYSVRNGDTVTLISNGVNSWVVGQRSNALIGTLTIPGWAPLPNGLLIQWGLTVTSAVGAVAVTFPVTFPTGCWALTTSFGQNTPKMATYDTLNATGFNLHGWQPETGARVGFNGVSWIAVGS